MCEQAAEAHKSKGSIQSSRRSRTSPDQSQFSKSSVDAMLLHSRSAHAYQVCFWWIYVALSYFSTYQYQMDFISYLNCHSCLHYTEMLFLFGVLWCSEGIYCYVLSILYNYIKN